MPDLGLGFAPHSGWAAVVGVGEAGDGFRVLVRERIEMVRADVPESKQPYHAVEGLAVDEAAMRLAGWEAEAERLATEALRGIGERLRAAGHRAIGAGILQSAGRKGKSLAETLASHALIHTADGEHFRNAIAAAAARCRLAVMGVPAREVASRAAAATGRTAKQLDALLKAAGREMGPPWTADQKSAALLAWLVLRQGSGAAPGRGGRR